MNKYLEKIAELTDKEKAILGLTGVGVLGATAGIAMANRGKSGTSQWLRQIEAIKKAKKYR